MIGLFLESGPGAQTLGRATVAHLGFGCRWSYYLQVSSSGIRSSDGSHGLGASVSAAWRQAGVVVPGLPAGRHAPFHFITFHNDWAVLYMRHNVDICIYVVSIYWQFTYFEFYNLEQNLLGNNEGLKCVLLKKVEIQQIVHNTPSLITAPSNNNHLFRFKTPALSIQMA